jgi:hypothetical protein
VCVVDAELPADLKARVRAALETVGRVMDSRVSQLALTLLDTVKL